MSLKIAKKRWQLFERSIIRFFFLLDPELAKPDQWVELKSPYVGYKTQKLLPISNTIRTSRYNKIISKGQTGIGIGIEESSEEIEPESPTDLQAVRLELAAPSEVWFYFLI